MFKRSRGRFSFGWLKLVLLSVLAVALIFLLYGWRLGSLTPGLSPAEASAIVATTDLALIANEPVNAPHKLAQYAASLYAQERWALRLPSVAFMVTFLGLFYLTLRLWFGRWVGFLGAIVFASTPWLIIIARSATPDILLLMPVAALSSALWLSRRTTARGLAWLAFCTTGALSLYVPGMLWFILAVLAFKYRSLNSLSRSINKLVVATGGLLFLILLAPLAYGIFQTPEIAKELLLVPDPLRDPLATLKSIGWSALSLFWRLPYTTDFTVGRLPLLTIAQLAFAAFGVYALWAKARSVIYWLAAIVGVSILAAGLNDRLALLLPAIMAASLLVAAGLRYLYVEWNSIFPRNPIPRSLAVVLMVVVVGLHLAYGLRYALVAWPNAPTTNQVYMLK